MWKLLKYNVAHMLEMARRKGVKLSLGDIFRSKELAWFGHDKPASMGRRNMTDQRWVRFHFQPAETPEQLESMKTFINTYLTKYHYKEKVELSLLVEVAPELLERAKTEINTLLTDYNSKVKKKSQNWSIKCCRR